MGVNTPLQMTFTPQIKTLSMAPPKNRQVLQKEFDIPMTETLETEVREMCNLSHGIRELGRAEGCAEGLLASIRSNELENTSAAIKTTKRITQTIRILQTYAEAGALLSSIADADDTYRFLVSGNYLIFYRVNEHDIYVDRILYGRRDYLRILFGDRT